jgi:uncharacterized protein (DUF305 family)
VDELEARVAVLMGEAAKHRAAIAGIEKFLATWSGRVNTDIARMQRMQIPWWRKVWVWVRAKTNPSPTTSA